MTVSGGHQKIPVRKVADISTRTISDPIGRKENDILRWKEYKTSSIEKGKVMPTDHTSGTSNLRLLCLCRKNSGKQKSKGALTERS